MAKMSNGGSNGKGGLFLNKDFWSHCEAVYYFLIVFLAALIFWLGAKFFNEVKQLSRPSLSSPAISVSAEGSVFVRPDVGVVSFSASSESSSVSEAQKKSAAAINESAKFIKNSGVEDKDLKTTSYTIQPIYDYPKGRREFRGYEVRQTMELKIRDLGKTGSILTGLAALGINEIGSLVFKVDNLEEAKKQAREKAVIDAKKKAVDLAASLGIKLGKMVSFNEFSGGPIPIFALESFGKGGDASSVTPATPTGENEITISVNMSFEIK